MSSSSRAGERSVRSIPSPRRGMRTTVDWMLLTLLFFAVLGGYHVHFMLTAGDWTSGSTGKIVVCGRPSFRSWRDVLRGVAGVFLG